MRAHLGEAYFSFPGSSGREKSWSSRYDTGARRRPRHHPPSPRTPLHGDRRRLAATARLALEHASPSTSHAAENRDQTDTSLARHGITPIEVLDRAGLLAPGREVAAMMPVPWAMSSPVAKQARAVEDFDGVMPWRARLVSVWSRFSAAWMWTGRPCSRASRRCGEVGVGHRVGGRAGRGGGDAAVGGAPVS